MCESVKQEVARIEALRRLIIARQKIETGMIFEKSRD